MSNVSLPSTAFEDDRGNQREDHRNDVRLRLLVEAWGDAHPDGQANLTVRDLSTTGVLFEADTGFAPLSIVRMTLPGIGMREARIVWSGSRYRGAEFIAPIDRSSVQAVYDRSKVVWPSFASGRSTGIEDRAAPNLASANDLAPADDVEEADRPALASGLKIQFVAALTVLLWTALAIGARTLMA